MTKLTTLLLAVAAGLTALWIVHFTRRGRPLGNGRFAALVAVFVALLGGCDEKTAAEPPKSLVTDEANKPASPREDAVPAPRTPAEARKALKAELAKLTSMKDGPGGVPRLQAETRTRMQALLAPLVEAQEISQEAAGILIAVHSDRIYHEVRSQASCYMAYPAIATRRDDVEKRLKLLAKAEADGTLKPEVVDKAKLALARGMEIVLLHEAVKKRRQATDYKGDPSPEDTKTMELVESYSTPIETDDRIEIRPEVAEARDFLIGLLKG